MSKLEPPPRRAAASSPAAGSSSTSPPGKPTWKDRMKATGKKAMDKGMVYSDKVGNKVNNVAEKKFGTEAFWPVTGDFPKEMDKAARILKAFTVDGVLSEVKLPKVGKVGKKVKMLRKIPPRVFNEAKGVAIFTSMRTGIAPFGGAGGAGIVIAKLEDGTWSAPASITPNNLSTGFLFGVDVYDCILVIRSQKAMDSFRTHKFTLGAEIGVAVGPYGGGAAVEAGLEKAPVLSYVRNKGMYAGVELVGQVFVERYDENAAMYHYPGVKAGEILSGKVKVPKEAANLIQALEEAETGLAQLRKGAMDIMIGEGPNGQDLPVDEGLDVSNEKMVEGAEHGDLAAVTNAEGSPSTGASLDSVSPSRTHTPMQGSDGTRTPERRNLPPMPPPRIADEKKATGPPLPPPPHHPSSRPASAAPPEHVMASAGSAGVSANDTVGDRLMPPAMDSERPGLSQHSSASHYSNEEEETAPAPSIEEMRRAAERMQNIHIRDGGPIARETLMDSPVAWTGPAPVGSETIVATHQRGPEEVGSAKEKKVEGQPKSQDGGVPVHRGGAGDEDPDGPPGYDESLR